MATASYSTSGNSYEALASRVAASVQQSVEPAERARANDGPRSQVNAVIFANVDDLDARWRHIQACGVLDRYPGLRAKEPTEYPWGIRVVHLIDPAGVCWHGGMRDSPARRGAPISAKDEDYRSTPRAWAARNDLSDMVELLLARGAPTRLPDQEPWATPLAWAKRRGHDHVALILRGAGATG